jgi:hypothetical protein
MCIVGVTASGTCVLQNRLNIRGEFSWFSAENNVAYYTWRCRVQMSGGDGSSTPPNGLNPPLNGNKRWAEQRPTVNPISDSLYCNLNSRQLAWQHDTILHHRRCRLLARSPHLDSRDPLQTEHYRRCVQSTRLGFLQLTTSPKLAQYEISDRPTIAVL